MPRVTAPSVKPGEKLAGPASYFPSIEKTYGHPVQHWLDLAADRLDDHTHMQVVDWLKSEHALGHGHANDRRLREGEARLTRAGHEPCRRQGNVRSRAGSSDAAQATGCGAAW